MAHSIRRWRGNIFCSCGLVVDRDLREEDWSIAEASARGQLHEGISRNAALKTASLARDFGRHDHVASSHAGISSSKSEPVVRASTALKCRARNRHGRRAGSRRHLARRDEPRLLSRRAGRGRLNSRLAAVAVSEVFGCRRAARKRNARTSTARAAARGAHRKMLRKSSTISACNIRRECRWFRQEGRAACSAVADRDGSRKPTRVSSKSPACGRRIGTVTCISTASRGRCRARRTSGASLFLLCLPRRPQRAETAAEGLRPFREQPAGQSSRGL